MNAETRAKEIADRARELYHQIDNCVVSGEAVSLIFNALRKAENDKLEEAARLMDRVMADSKAALIRTLKHED